MNLFEKLLVRILLDTIWTGEGVPVIVALPESTKTDTKTKIDASSVKKQLQIGFGQVIATELQDMIVYSGMSGWLDLVTLSKDDSYQIIITHVSEGEVMSLLITYSTYRYILMTGREQKPFGDYETPYKLEEEAKDLLLYLLAKYVPYLAFDVPEASR